MSDTTPSPDARDKDHVPDEDLVRHVTDFLQDVGAQLACPCCKHTEWDLELAPEPGFRVGFLMQARPADDESKRTNVSGYLAAVVLTCVNCGFLRVHRHAVFSKWMKKKKSSPGEKE
ncbi:hypothetical protein [Bordetella genomosp. 2]|uniref:hypothetical protein n=1 Tax=Bordetella genomosp. 2 TaxID=1983456 RepID=UPI0011405FD6|nr:hypothetical protein [Bordetella genomosp. 2]